MQERQWITARRSELDALAEELAKQLQEVQAERDELAIVERVLNRPDEQARADAGALAPVFEGHVHALRTLGGVPRSKVRYDCEDDRVPLRAVA
ncbi:hypothetical protein AB0D34_46615 [Streptomyces sp. NPDC048420]|uniref:hypothetical protein n=1 Tax=Streptomyces sp. NPDC048420 TaxID=3155755 RepID=UPI00342AA962